MPLLDESFGPRQVRQDVAPVRAVAPVRKGGTGGGGKGSSRPVAPVPAAPPPPPDPYRANRDALDTFRSILSQYDLGSLSQQVFDLMAQGKSEFEIVLVVRKTPEYKTRFPAMEQLRARGRAISEDQYVEFERRAVELYRAAGLPQGFYDSPADFANLIDREVGLGELQTRILLARTAASQAPPDVREELQRFYGLDEGAVTAYWLDPDRTVPLLQTQYAAGELGAASRRTGIALTREQAESLAREGISAQQAATGFTELAQSRELFLGLPGSGEEEITLEEQLGAAFRGDIEAQEKITRRARERKAEFEGRGTFVTSRSGVEGLQEE